MINDKLTGNLATENLVQYTLQNNIELSLDLNKFNDALNFSNHVFTSSVES